MFLLFCVHKPYTRSVDVPFFWVYNKVGEKVVGLVKNKAYVWITLKIVLLGLLSVFAVLAGLEVTPSFFRMAIIGFVLAAEIVLIHWIVEVFRRRSEKIHPVDEGTNHRFLTVPVRRVLGIVSIFPLPVFLLMFALMPGQGLWLFPIGVMAGAIAMATGGLSISRKKPYVGWVGFAMALVMYFLIVIAYLTSL